MKDIKNFINESVIELVTKPVKWKGIDFTDYCNKGNNRHKAYTKSDLNKFLKGLPEKMPPFVIVNYDYEIDNKMYSPSDCSRLWLSVLKKDGERAKEILKKYNSNSHMQYFDIIDDKDIVSFLYDNSK